MKSIDRDGLLLCDIQAKTFELSLSSARCSSEIFIRRFMYSNVSTLMDNLSFLDSNLQARDILDSIDEEFGKTGYGSVKYTANEMHWIGYIYRYFAYTCEKSSKQVYRIIKPKELRSLYLPYHTMDPAKAVDMILEARGLALDEEAELKRQYEILKRIGTPQFRKRS